MNKNVVISFVLFSLFWLALIVYTLISFIPETPIKINKSYSKIKYYVPQGWGFFTKEPRSNLVYVYKYDENNNLKLFQHPNSSPRYFFGLKKISRAIGLEYGRIINDINPHWEDFVGEDKLVYYAENTRFYTYKNMDRYPRLKGDFVFVAYEPIPWAWSTSFDRNNRKGKILKIKVE